MPLTKAIEYLLQCKFEAIQDLCLPTARIYPFTRCDDALAFLQTSFSLSNFRTVQINPE